MLESKIILTKPRKIHPSSSNYIANVTTPKCEEIGVIKCNIYKSKSIKELSKKELEKLVFS